jgi:hypothetical protein
MDVNDNKLKRMAMAIKMLNSDDTLEELLTSLGLSSEDLLGYLESLASDFQVSILTFEGLDATKTRVFSLWEQAYLSGEAREFLLSALHSQTITPMELEQSLAVLFAQSEGLTDVDEVRGVLESVVEDPNRMAMLGLLDLDYVH